MNIFQVAVLVVTCLTNVLAIDYHPCSYTSYDRTVNCEGTVALQAVGAFHRNRNDSSLTRIRLAKMEDMTDELVAQIMDIVSVSAAESLVDITMSHLPLLTKIPEGLNKFKLTNFAFYYNDGIKTIQSNSIYSSKLSTLYVYSNANLEVIEPGAFQGNFDFTEMEIWGNKLKQFDEAVFKPLFKKGRRPRINVIQNRIPCDCNLAWIIRDHPTYLYDVHGSCIDVYTNVILFENVEVETLQDC